MEKNKTKISPHGLYHVVSRAIEERKIFAKQKDIFRFVFQAYAANIGSPIKNVYRKGFTKAGRDILQGREFQKNLIIVEHPPLVWHLSFVFVVTHFHEIIMAQNLENVSKYLQKRHTGFAKYFNLRYGRRNNLFERPVKIVPIQDETQLEAVLRYVNIINVLDVYDPKWRKKGLRDPEEAFKFIENYPFSSFPDLFGQRNSKLIAPSEIIKKFLGDNIREKKIDYIKGYQEFLEEQVKKFQDVCIE